MGGALHLYGWPPPPARGAGATVGVDVGGGGDSVGGGGDGIICNGTDGTWTGMIAPGGILDGTWT